MAKARVKVTKVSVTNKVKVKKNKTKGNPNRCSKCGRFI